MTPEELASGAGSNNNRPAAVACIECRKKHLKCDAVTPVCSRCSFHGRICTYAPSQRGIAGRGRKRHSSVLESDVGASPYPDRFAGHQNIDRNAINDIPAHGIAAQPSIGRPETAISSIGHDIRTHAIPHNLNDADEAFLIGQYYSNFHASHPVLVPKSYFQVQFYPDYLVLLICFIGSHFSTKYDSDTLQPSVDRALTGLTGCSPYRIQAYLLYAIALHARQRASDAVVYIERAAALALGFGINHPNYADATAPYDDVRAESLRRTWWELYIVDCFLATLHKRESFQTAAAKVHPYLPGEDSLWLQGICQPRKLTLEQLSNRMLSEQDLDFSSYCYRIEAVRIISRVRAVSAAREVHSEDVQAVDNAIASWRHSLPDSKSSILDPDGNVDQMLFQANMLINAAIVLLHFPRCDLPLTVPQLSDIECTRAISKMPATSNQHTVKATMASKELSSLATLPCPLSSHSPFFTCGLILGCIVQLAISSIHPKDSLQSHRERVELIITALGRLGQQWAVSRNAVQNVSIVARGIFMVQSNDNPIDCGSAQNSGIDAENWPSDISWFDFISLEESQP
ncbi:hypothetical protein K431DRAFT_38931 [Polychaeton citri CBS 116435]|uniref:Zn(2)-C6 fungal-type domain-containing protein n=1 Tax=Polychaeton citri CBS 116435 TaxID=1314669 RepID=A0A9P4QBN9_9PEZI|nr:hypothetical protein K431DRAFT_38931 [Polychaeton citri CBS 116435]